MKQAVTLIIPLVVLTSGIILTGEVWLKNRHVEIAAASTQAVATESDEDTAVTATAISHKSIPAESLYQLLAAEMALDRGHPDIALVNYIAAARQTQDPGVAERATEISLGMGSLEDALVASTLWSKIATNNLDAQITTAALYIRQDQTAKALPYLQRSIQLNPEQAYEYFVVLYRQLPDEKDSGRFVDALKTLSNNFQYDTAPLTLAQIYLFQAKDNLALKMSQIALKINPNSYQAIVLNSEALLKSKDKYKAKEFLEEEIKKNQHNLQLRYYFAQFLQQQEFTKEAYKESEIVFKEAQFTPSQLIDYGRFCIEATWYDLAEKAFLKASKDSETQDVAHYFLARLAQLENHDKKAIEWFQQVLTGPFHVISQIRASLLLADEKQYDQALSLLARTQPSTEAEKKQLILSQADILNQAKDFPQAFNVLSDAIKENPNEIDFLYARGLIADELDKTEVAEKDFKLILSIEPNNINTLNALGFILANKTNRFDEAKTYLSHALSLSPNNASVLDSMGWLYYKTGDYQQAVATLQKAMKIQPDATTSAHLGEVLWHMKEFAKAKSVWESALSQFPQHDTLQAVMTHYLSAQDEEKEGKK